MKYEVRVGNRAASDADAIFRWIARDAPEAAERWYSRLFTAMTSLASFPNRCAKAPEARRAGVAIRQLLFGDYRVLFVVRKRTVFVIHIRHGAQRNLSTKEVRAMLN